MPSDVRVVLRFLTGETEALYVLPPDAQQLYDAVGTVDAVEFETDDLQRYRVNGGALASVQMAAKSAPWEINVNVIDPTALTDLGLYDEDGDARDKAEWTRQDDVAEAFPVSIYTRGLESRPPAWLRSLSDALAAQGIEHQVMSQPTPPKRKPDLPAPPSDAAIGWDDPVDLGDGTDGGPDAPVQSGATVRYSAA